MPLSCACILHHGAVVMPQQLAGRGYLLILYIVFVQLVLYITCEQVSN